MDPTTDSQPEEKQLTPEPLTKEEFVVLWTIDYLEYRTPQEVTKTNDMDLENTTLIFMKLEDIGLIKFEIKNKQIQPATTTILGQEVLKEEQYYDYVPE